MSISRGTVHSIQFLRFVAATLVVVFHAHLAQTDPFEATLNNRAYLFGFGASGVHIFFVISGYIMYLTNFGRDATFRTAPFLMRRLVRIYPIYWIFAGIYIATHLALGDPFLIAPERLPGALMLWPDDVSLVIGPAWTLAYEIYFYLVFGIVMLAGARWGPVVLTLLFTACIVAGGLLHFPGALGGLVASSLLLEFVAGVWVARLTLTREWPRWSGWAASAAAVVLYGAGLAYGYHRLPSALMWGIPSVLLVFGFVVLERTGGVPGTRRASVLGDSSYVLYLCHILLIDLVIRALAAADVVPPAEATLATTVLLCIAFAHAFHRIVERPLVRRLHRFVPGQRGVKTGA